MVAINWFLDLPMMWTVNDAEFTEQQLADYLYFLPVNVLQIQSPPPKRVLFWAEMLTDIKKNQSLNKSFTMQELLIKSFITLI